MSTERNIKIRIVTTDELPATVPACCAKERQAQAGRGEEVQKSAQAKTRRRARSAPELLT